MTTTKTRRAPIRTRGKPTDVDRHVGVRIRQRRLILGMGQEDLGDALSLTFQQVQKYERGSNRVSAGRLHQLGKALGVPVGYFFEGLDDTAAAEMPPDLSRTEVAIGRAAGALPIDAQRKILAFLRAVKEGDDGRAQILIGTRDAA